MRATGRVLTAAMLAMAMLAPAAAQAQKVLDGASAQAQLFDPLAAEVEVTGNSGLSDQDKVLLRAAVGTQKYYAVVALPPAEGLMSPAAAIAANYHDLATAEKTALAECDAKRSGGRKCVVAARVRPTGWQARDFQLSSDATEAFVKAFRRGSGPRAFAVSKTTGLWGVARGEAAAEAAVADCVARDAARAPRDCKVVVAD